MSYSTPIDRLTPDRVVAHSTYVADMYKRAYDFNRYESGEPRVDYMVAATPRSGSTHLTMELWRTGVMGAPLEYLNPPFRRVFQKRTCLSDNILEYWHSIRRSRTSPNGAFGHKVFASDYTCYSRTYPELLPHLAPDKVLFVTRSDVVAQSVSYSMAIRSGAWYGGISKIRYPAYDALHIMFCIEALEYQRALWTELFALTNTNVYEISYEELLDDLGAVVNGVAEFLEVELDPGATIELPRMHIQRDSTSAQWIDRFKHENMEALERAYRTVITNVDSTGAAHTALSVPSDSR